MLQDRTYELSSRTHAAGKWALVLSGVALVLLGMVLLGMTSSQPRSMPAVISVALPANWNTVASRFQVLRPWGPEKRTLANEVFELPPLNQQAVIENGNILSNVSVPATPRFDGDNTSNYMYNPPYDTAPPRDGIKDATKDSTTQLTTIVDGNGAPSTKSLDEPVATGVASGSGSGSAWPPGLMVFKTGGPVDIHTALLGSGSGSGSFQFDEGPWSECSATCGQGAQMRTVTCVDSKGAAQPSSKCSGTAGKGWQYCNKDPCATDKPVEPTLSPTNETKYDWALGPMSECSVTCGGGVQMALAFCQDQATQQSAEESNCEAMPLKPKQLKDCNQDKCPDVTDPPILPNFRGTNMPSSQEFFWVKPDPDASRISLVAHRHL